MQIETKCPGCGRTLRVAAEHAGKSARCPVCSTIYQVAGKDGNGATDLPPGDRWFLKTPEGQTYGPVTRTMLDGWVSEGRVGDDCRLMLESEGIWQEASVMYPVLRPPQRKLFTPAPVFDNPVTGSRPYPTASSAAMPSRIVNPHRGGLILALGILSWALGCPVFGIMAWVFGSNDLHDMRRGAMDPSGLNLTQAGQVIGMIHAILTLIVLVFGVFALLVVSLL
jgi:hypothetical protein